MNQIHIDEVLLLIQERATQGKTFAISFVRATGKQMGSIKTVVKARYGSASREASTEAEKVLKVRDEATTMINFHISQFRVKVEKISNEARKVSLHVESGTIPLTDVEKNQYFTPLIRTIVRFDSKTVIH